MMAQFFQNNDNLKVLEIEHCNFGVEGSRALALALGSCKNSSLTKFLVHNDIEGMVDIITALSMHRRLQHIDFDYNLLRNIGCIAMATLLQHSVTQLQVLDLGSNEVEDEGIDALVPALKSCRDLKTLRLCDNPSITSRGWQHLASILDDPNLNLMELILTNNYVDDEAAAEIASSLRNNSTLTNLGLGSNHEITKKGWEPFCDLLCDTSCVNSTFLSNHTLESLTGGISIGEDTNMNSDQMNTTGRLLDLNGDYEDKKEVAMVKILQTHNDFDMTPFFEWEFKVLPLMINWFERASSLEISSRMPEDYEPFIEQRQLSCVYQFVRGMPLLYVETYLMKELEDIKAARKQKQEELVILEDRQKSIMKRLGQQRGVPS